MLSDTEIRENLTAQVHELEALQSVYPKELKLTDHGVVADINDFISDNSKTDLPCRLEYNIQIPDINGDLELHVIIPLEYPNTDPDVYVRSDRLDRNEQLKLNKALLKFMETQEKGEPVIYSIISWLQEAAENYLVEKISHKKNSKPENEKVKEFARYWVYSHHIYSKVKRREILDLAKECNLTGFCLAGKPGIICIEGDVEDCDYWWLKIKIMNWHRILVKYRETAEFMNSPINDCRKFVDFQEISFPISDRHNDMGQLLKYLTQHDSQHVFKHLFGIEGKSSDDK